MPCLVLLVQLRDYCTPPKATFNCHAKRPLPAYSTCVSRACARLLAIGLQLLPTASAPGTVGAVRSPLHFRYYPHEVVDSVPDEVLYPMQNVSRICRASYSATNYLKQPYVRANNHSKFALLMQFSASGRAAAGAAIISGGCHAIHVIL